MPRRMVGVLAAGPAMAGPAAPPGVPPAGFALAALEDICDLVAGLAGVEPALLLGPGVPDSTAGLAWPGTIVHRIATPAARATDPVAALAVLAGLGAAEGVVLAADAPDLPAILLAKLFQALGQVEAAACPAEGGGLVAVGARLPLVPWLAGLAIDLDAPDALLRLARAAPAPEACTAVSGWHRLRTPADLARLDPGLEGWPATRALLRGRR